MYNMQQAVKATGKSKPTIQRAIKSGKISAKKDANGHYEIDPAELHRVYPLVPNETGEPSHTVSDETKRDGNETGEPELLKVKLEAANKLLSEREDTISDLRDRLDKSEEERTKSDARLTALLTDDRPWRPVKDGLFSRIMKRRRGG